MNFSTQILTYESRYLHEWIVQVPWRSYWRLWWHEQEAGVAHTEEGDISLAPDHFTLVAPNTNFSVTLRRPIQHLYVHFQLTAPF